ncbi:MAG: acyl carrier protein, partial [Bacteroidota bacterium]|nr:acyl carrier protein [Bacteroidota bacterium]
INEIHENGVVGWYRFRESESFYKHHFKNNPVTPGVILTECMAQIGLVCFGIYLNPSLEHASIVMTENHVIFEKIVLPDEVVIVSSTLVYYRFNKLKVQVNMRNENNEIIARGTLSGMITDHF